MSSEQPIHEKLSEQDWYDTARAKAETFIHTIDPELSVEVLPTEKGLALAFYHHEDERLGWVMPLGELSMTYIETNLEAAVRDRYMHLLEDIHNG